MLLRCAHLIHIMPFQVFYYSNGVFLKAGIPEDKTAYAVLGTGVINVLITGISVSAYFLEPFV